MIVVLYPLFLIFTNIWKICLIYKMPKMRFYDLKFEIKWQPHNLADLNNLLIMNLVFEILIHC